MLTPLHKQVTPDQAKMAANLKQNCWWIGSTPMWSLGMFIFLFMYNANIQYFRLICLSFPINSHPSFPSSIPWEADSMTRSLALLAFWCSQWETPAGDGRVGGERGWSLHSLYLIWAGSSDMQEVAAEVMQCDFQSWVIKWYNFHSAFLRLDHLFWGGQLLSWEYTPLRRSWGISQIANTHLPAM